MTILIAEAVGAKRTIGTGRIRLERCTCADCTPSFPDDRDATWESDLAAPQAADSSLKDWVSTQASYYRSLDSDFGKFVARDLELLHAAIFSDNIQSVDQLLHKFSSRYSNADLDGLAEHGPAERHMSLFADELDIEVKRYIALGGQAALLVAWSINRLADDAEDLGAASLEDYYRLYQIRANERFEDFLLSEAREGR